MFFTHQIQCYVAKFEVGPGPQDAFTSLWYTVACASAHFVVNSRLCSIYT